MLTVVPEKKHFQESTILTWNCYLLADEHEHWPAWNLQPTVDYIQFKIIKEKPEESHKNMQNFVAHKVTATNSLMKL